MNDVMPAGPAGPSPRRGRSGEEGSDRLLRGGAPAAAGAFLAALLVAVAVAVVLLLATTAGSAGWGPSVRTVDVPFVGVSGLAWDGERLWVTVDGDGRAYRVDPADGRVEGHLDLPAPDTGGSAWDGRVLYQLAYLEHRIHRLDPRDGRVLGYLPTPGDGLCSGLTWDGSALWVAAFEDGRLYRVDPQSGAVLASREAPFQTTGLAWDGRALWHGVLVGAEEHDHAPVTGFVQRLGEAGTANRAVPVPGVFAGTSDWLPGVEGRGGRGGGRQWWFDGHHGRLVELSFAPPAGFLAARGLAAVVVGLGGGLLVLLLAGGRRAAAVAPDSGRPAVDGVTGGIASGDGTAPASFASPFAPAPGAVPSGRRGRLPRAVRLAGRAAVLGTLLALHGARLVATAAFLAVRGRRHEVPGRAGRELCLVLTRAGAAFIKLGQVLSSRPDLLPASVVGPLRDLQDRVPPFAERHLPGRLAADLGPAVAAELAPCLETRPLAAASVAQVYRGRLADGTPVAVKVRRPGIERQVADDLALLAAGAALLERLPALRVVPLRDLVGEVAECVRQQLDFRREAANLERFRANFAGVDRIRLPRPLAAWSGGGVLTMELLDELRRVDDPELPEGDGRAAALAGVKALYKMIFLDGFIHADLHPGNVFVRPYGELALVDAGLVAELRGDDLGRFVDFFSGMVGNDGRACARVVVETASWLSPRFREAAFEASMVELIDRHARLRADEFEVSGFAVQLFDTQRRHGVRGSTRFTMTILSLAVFEGIVKQLHPKLDFQRAAVPYLLAARGRLAAGG